MPYFLGSFKISGGLSLIGAVVAEFVAALLLTTGLGVLIFVSLSIMSDTILGKWHESAIKHEN